MASTTTRSKKALADDGWYPETVEHWNHYTQRRHDLFKFADIIAMKTGETPLLVQTTTGTNLAARRDKIYASDLAALALQSGFRIILHGWRKLKVKRGGKAMRWAVLEEEVTLAQIMAARRKKIYASDLAALALQSGFRIILHGWRKLKVKRGGKAVRWAVLEEEVTLPQIMAVRAKGAA